MHKRARILSGVVCTLVALVLTVPAGAQSKDEKKRQKELQEAMQHEARPVVMLIDELQKQQAPGDPQAYVVNPKESDPAKMMTPATPAVDVKAVVLHHDMMKAVDGKVYAPYTIALPADALPQGPVSVYMRVTQKGSAPPADTPKDGVRFPFEDFFSATPRTAAGQASRLMRAFAAPPGEYDVYFGIRAKAADPKKSKDDPVRVVTFKQTVTLDNFWDGALRTSSVVVAGKVETLQGQLSPEQQRERPYVFGTTEFLPSPDNKFTKAEELSVVFQIYNPTLQDGRPDVTVEYNFHQKLAEGEKFFNKTSPQRLNAESLPPSFDVVSLQMLPGGQSVPLASFPAGDYRMEIKVTDNFAKKTLTKDIMFSVLGS